jgi:hypothetical protein
MSIGEAKVASESASSYALATCPEPALPDQVDHQRVDQLSGIRGHHTQLMPTRLGTDHQSRPRSRRRRRDSGYNGFSILTIRMGYLKAGFLEGSTAVTR